MECVSSSSAGRRNCTPRRSSKEMLGMSVPRSSSQQQGHTSRRCRGVQVFAAKDVDFADRAVGALPYLVPLFDGIKYGRFLFLQFPFLPRLLAPLNPLISFYFSFPFASLIVFFAIYGGIVQNQNFSRFVRYNALQAILLDIILIVPGLLENILRPPSGGFGLSLYMNAYNTIFLFVFLAVLYAMGSCLIGQAARLPLVADAADQQVR
ncbi:Protein TIC 20-v, chloroplastic [Coccomyxa sp. Obi]|nr:Protein TIC 20-v, chloroplastic [Coccomyxa sp. Obi]